MPFTKSQSSDSSALRDLAYSWGKVVTRRTFGEAGPRLDLDFDSIESLAVEIAQALLQGTVEEILRTQTELLGAEQPCPHCERPCPVRTEPRSLTVRAGTTIHYDEPVGHCPACRRDFFQQPDKRLEHRRFSGEAQVVCPSAFRGQTIS
jgi:hypothetical protein